MRDEDFKNTISKELDELCKENRYSSKREAFVHWALKNLFDLEESDIYEAIIGGSGDKGIDAFWIDEENEVINVLQSKLPDSSDKNLDKNEIHKLIRSINWLKDPTGCKNNALIEKSSEFKSARRKSFSINFIPLTFGKIEKDALDEIEKFRSTENKSDSIQQFDYPEIKNKYEEKLSMGDIEVPDEIELDTTNGEFFEKTTKDAIIMSINAEQLQNIEAKHHSKLFHENVRYFLGAKSNRVNKGILDTLKNEKGNFWYYNNGLSIVCKDYQLNKGKILILEPQIINGCQTTTSIARSPNVDGSITVLARIIKSQDKKFAAKICETSNTQNPVKDRDLRSLDDKQRELKNVFKSLGYYYEIKKYGYETEKKNDKTKYKQILNNEKVAKAYLAFIGKPADARSRLYRLFNKSEYYPLIFSPERTAEELLLSFKLLEKIESKIKKIKKNGEPKFEYLKYSAYILLAAFGKVMNKYYFEKSIVISKNFDSVNSKKILDDTNFDASFGMLFDILETLLTESIRIYKETLPDKDSYSHDVYLKKDLALNNLMKTIEHHEALEKARGEDLYKNIKWPSI